MQRAKAFMYVSVGLLALAIAYHLGARSANAQAGSATAQSAVNSSLIGTVSWQASQFAIVVDRVAYRAEDGLPLHLTGSLPPVPGVSPVIAFGNDNALLENGDVYDWTGSAWRFKGNLLPTDAPIPVLKSTWGQLKAKYRAPREGR